MSLGKRLQRGGQISRAFFRLGFLDLISYPLAFVTGNVAPLVPAVIYYFVAGLVPDTAAVGFDYYTFVIIGMIGMRFLDAGLQGFGVQLDQEIQAGRLEALLVEPIRWRLLPFALVQFGLLTRTMVCVGLFAVSWVLGASYRLEGLLPTLLVLMLGLAATLSLGILAASVKILAKRSDPILTFYTMAASIFSGVFFPLESLPGWIQPLSYAIPHTYVIGASRKLLMPEGAELPGLEVWPAVGGLVVMCVILYPVSLWIYGRALEYGRKLGVLAGY